MTNEQIAAKLDALADLMELQGQNPFRIRAYRNGAQAVRNLPQAAATLVAQQIDLTQYSGIGDSVAQKCREIIDSGSLKQLDELEKQVPPTLVELLRIPELGPKRAAQLHRDLKIQTLGQLRAACLAGKVRELKGFGEKSEQKILAGIDLAEQANARVRWADAEKIVNRLRDHLQQYPGIQQMEFAGSFRRGRDTIGDLDILAVADDPSQLMDHLGNFPSLAQVQDRGPTKMSIRLADGLQVDLRCVPQESFGAALQYFTGSKQHNVRLRTMAKRRGLKISEWGVFRVGENGQPDEQIAGESEDEVYAALELPWIPPELREDRNEFEWAEQGQIPNLVTLKQLRGDLHMHTNATDGKATIEEMAEAARQRGLKYIAITDHSPRVTMARGLDPVRLRAQWREIDQFNEKQSGGFRILKGIECDILADGRMDLPDDVLAEADWVMASIHYNQNLPKAEMTQRMLCAIRHPYVTAISHPTGRLINRRPSYELDFDKVFAAAREHHKFMELNADPRRLDLDDVHCAAAKAAGIPIVISSDAHSTTGMDNLRFGVMQARRAGLTADDVVNTLPLNKLLRLVAQARRDKH